MTEFKVFIPGEMGVLPWNRALWIEYFMDDEMVKFGFGPCLNCGIPAGKHRGTIPSCPDRRGDWSETKMYYSSGAVRFMQTKGLIGP